MNLRCTPHLPIALLLACAAIGCAAPREFGHTTASSGQILPCSTTRNLPLAERERTLAAHLKRAEAPFAAHTRGKPAATETAYHLTNSGLAMTHPLSYLCEVALAAQKAPSIFQLRNTGIRLTLQPLEAATHSRILLALSRRMANEPSPKGLASTFGPRLQPASEFSLRACQKINWTLRHVTVSI
jgi:hypothetical protein